MDIVDLYFRDARRLLAEWPAESRFTRYLRVVMWSARKYMGRGVDYEDLVQIGNLALSECSDDDSKAVVFRAIRRVMWIEIKERATCVRIPQLHKPMKRKSLPDGARQKQAEERLDTAVLEMALASLPERQSVVIRLRLEGENRAEIARRMKVSTPTVCEYERRATERLFDYFGRASGGVSLTDLGVVCGTTHTKDDGNVRFLEAFGERKTIAQWAAELGVSKDRIRTRLKRGATIEQALSLPCHARKAKTA